MAATDPRELKAREAYAAGRYQEALELFAKLYAESLHPNYLRNIGRCYQHMGDPDRALNSFHDYLQKAKGLKADERKEIDGYIKEMEELKRKKEAAAATSSAPPPPPPVEPVKPLPSAVAPPPSTSTATASVVLTPPPPQHAEESSPIYGRWWFWAIVGGAVATGLGVAAAAGVFTRTQDATCPTADGYRCP
jgi:hypothetical protein